MALPRRGSGSERTTEAAAAVVRFSEPEKSDRALVFLVFLVSDRSCSAPIVERFRAGWDISAVVALPQI
jgi:hypothetical protein